MRDWTKLSTELIWAYEGVLKSSYVKLPRDIEPGTPIYFIEKGSLTLETESGELKIPEGHWVIITQKLKRRDFSLGAKIISIRFHLVRPDGRSFFDEGFPQTFAHEANPELYERTRPLLEIIHASIPEAYTDLWSQWSDLDSYLMIQEAFYAWLRCLIRICQSLDRALNPYEGLDDRMQMALAHLDELPLDAELTEASLARRVGLSVSQLNRLFNAQLGESPKQYWDGRRFNAAITQLSSSATPIKQLAQELGFRSQNYFARWFRKRAGLTPSEYRAKYSSPWQRY